MQDIRRSLMIFHLKENYSKEELQKAYKKLVKKYHPDFNQDNQEWSHKKMTEINLAYEQCQEYLDKPREKSPPSSPGANGQPASRPFSERDFEDIFRTAARQQKRENQKSPPAAEKLSPELQKAMTALSPMFNKITGRYYEYGLENRFLRYEGNRRFRYRQCLKEFERILKRMELLPDSGHSNYDKYAQKLYRNFIVNYYNYIILDEGDIPRHPTINPHWHKMEEYLNASLMDYLASYLTDRFRKISWKVTFTHSVTHINYLKNKYPRLNENSSFKSIVKLAESYAEIREEEEKNNIRFFFL